MGSVIFEKMSNQEVKAFVKKHNLEPDGKWWLLSKDELVKAILEKYPEYANMDELENTDDDSAKEKTSDIPSGDKGRSYWCSSACYMLGADEIQKEEKSMKGEVLTPSRVIEFFNHYYTTNDPKIMAVIENSVDFKNGKIIIVGEGDYKKLQESLNPVFKEPLSDLSKFSQLNHSGA